MIPLARDRCVLYQISGQLRKGVFAIFRCSAFHAPELVKAHTKLDALVDKAYGRTFASDADRVAHLFSLYAQKVAPDEQGSARPNPYLRHSRRHAQEAR